MQKRGMLTERVKAKTKELFGYEFTIKELRLLPYLQYVMMNTQILEPKHIDCEERKILSKWRKAGYVEGGASGMAITKEFWDKMNAVLWLGYVDLGEELEHEAE